MTVDLLANRKLLNEIPGSFCIRPAINAILRLTLRQVLNFCVTENIAMFLNYKYK